MKLTPKLEKMIKEAAGVSVHGKSLRLTFRYRGVKCREALSGLEVNAANVRYAADRMATIRMEMTKGTFSYSDHFPTSANAVRFDGPAAEGDPEKVLFREQLRMYLTIKESKLSPSGFRGYASKAKRVRLRFGGTRIDQIKQSEIEVWRTELIREGLATKTINDTMTILRGTFRVALKDGLILTDPTDGVSNYVPNKETNNADPFSREEIRRMEAGKTNRPAEKACVCFNVWVGLSVSELIALSWDDIDMDQRTLKVRRARVSGEFKVPKEKYRERIVEILPPAMRWLEEQRERTYHLPPMEVDVRGRDNITTYREVIRPVWRMTFNGEIIHGDAFLRDKFFSAFLRDNNLRVRPVNQTRHTFASQMLTSLVPKDWIIKQLGHKDYSMLYKHYGKWIENDTPLLADTVMKCLGMPMPAEAQAAPQGPKLEVVNER